MHVEERRAEVDHVHAEAGHVLRDRAAAALLHLAELGHLPRDLVVVEELPHHGHELRARVGGAALRRAARILGDGRAALQLRLVAGGVHILEMRIGRRRHVRRQHRGPFQAAPHVDVILRALTHKHLGDGVLEEARLHARRTHRPDLLLVAHHDGGGHRRHAFQLQQRGEPGIGAHAVIVPIRRDERTVEPDFARHPRRYDLQLRREEVRLLHAKLLLDKLQQLILLADGCDHIEIFGREELLDGLLLQVVGQMRQQVGDHEDGITRPIAERDLHLRAILLHDRAVERQRQHKPLVLLDAAVDVRVEIDHAVLLVQRFRLEVETRRVRMAAHHADAVGDRLFADHRRHHRLAVVAAVHPVAGLERLEGRNLPEPGLLQKLHRLRVGAALRLGDGEVVHVLLRVRLTFGCQLLVHVTSPVRVFPCRPCTGAAPRGSSPNRLRSGAAPGAPP